jgi:hypothetical protein
MVHLRDALGELRGYSRFRARRCPTGEERGEKMLYGDYEHVLAKERMQTAIREREHTHLVKQLRSASRSSRSGLIARSAALITSLFR